MSQSEKKGAQVSAKDTAETDEKSKRFSDVERAAMQQRAKELKAEERASKNKAEGENDVFAKIAEMVEPDRTMATRLHEIILAAAPALASKTWYGMPSYTKDGKIVCFYQPAQKFSTRYAILGFNDVAHLDDGDMWPTYFALNELTADVEARITELVKKAVS